MVGNDFVGLCRHTPPSLFAPFARVVSVPRLSLSLSGWFLLAAALDVSADGDDETSAASSSKWHDAFSPKPQACECSVSAIRRVVWRSRGGELSRKRGVIPREGCPPARGKEAEYVDTNAVRFWRVSKHIIRETLETRHFEAPPQFRGGADSSCCEF